MPDGSDDKAPEKKPPVIRFDYIKSNFFRVVHADGVVGGTTPKGTLLMTFWNERAPIPQRIAHTLQLDEAAQTATLGPELPEERVVREAVVREVEVGIIMDYKCAAAVHEWLSRHLETLKGMEGGQDESKKEGK